MANLLGRYKILKKTLTQAGWVHGCHTTLENEYLNRNKCFTWEKLHCTISIFIQIFGGKQFIQKKKKTLFHLTESYHWNSGNSVWFSFILYKNVFVCIRLESQLQWSHEMKLQTIAFLEQYFSLHWNKENSFS